MSWIAYYLRAVCKLFTGFYVCVFMGSCTPRTFRERSVEMLLIFKAIIKSCIIATGCLVLPDDRLS